MTHYYCHWIYLLLLFHDILTKSTWQTRDDERNYCTFKCSVLFCVCHNIHICTNPFNGLSTTWMSVVAFSCNGCTIEYPIRSEFTEYKGYRHLFHGVVYQSVRKILTFEWHHSELHAIVTAIKLNKFYCMA